MLASHFYTLFYTTRRRVASMVCSLLLLVFSNPYATANTLSSDIVIKPSIQALLNNVVNASRYYSYSGLLTYEANGSLSTLSLYQRIDYQDQQRRVYQILEFLDGARRRVVREQGLQSCVAGKTRWGLWPSAFNVNELQRHYNVSIEGRERVANRASWLLKLQSKDDFRYSYFFNIDQQTGLLLRSIIVEKKTIVERTQFLSVELFGEKSSTLGEQQTISWRVPEVDPCHTEQFQSAWKVEWLPEGFASVGNRITARGEQVLMFSDGLVSISVFITSQKYENLPKITARRGATIAVMSPLLFDREKSVAVVGEVPTVNARRIAVSVKPQ